MHIHVPLWMCTHKTYWQKTTAYLTLYELIFIFHGVENP